MLAVYTDYFADSHASYRAMWRHPDTDEVLGRNKLLADLAASVGCQDGDEVEITIRKTGRRPFGSRRVLLVAPHTYEREPAGDGVGKWQVKIGLSAST